MACKCSQIAFFAPAVRHHSKMLLPVCPPKTIQCNPLGTFVAPNPSGRALSATSQVNLTGILSRTHFTVSAGPAFFLWRFPPGCVF